MDINKKPGTRKWKLWTGIVAALFIIWFGGWFVLADYGEDIVDREIARLATLGLDINCDNRAIRGFPFRAGLFCDQIRVFHRRSNFLVEAGAVRSTALLIMPNHAIIELDAPLFITGRDDLPVVVHWENIRASIAGDTGGLQRMSSTVNKLEFQFPKSLAGVLDGLETKHGELHLRPTPKSKADDLDLAFSFDAVRLISQEKPTNIEVSLSTDIRIGSAIINYLNNRPTGEIHGQIRSLMISLSSGGIVRLAGPFVIDQQGLVSGNIRLAVDELDRIIIQIQRMNPQLTGVLRPILSALSSLGKRINRADGQGREITLKIKQGRIKLGIIELGRIPPLRRIQAGS